LFNTGAGLEIECRTTVSLVHDCDKSMEIVTLTAVVSPSFDNILMEFHGVILTQMVTNLHYLGGIEQMD
jgi:hypothetical protein